MSLQPRRFVLSNIVRSQVVRSIASASAVNTAAQRRPLRAAAAAFYTTATPEESAQSAEADIPADQQETPKMSGRVAYSVYAEKVRELTRDLTDAIALPRRDARHVRQLADSLIKITNFRSRNVLAVTESDMEHVILGYAVAVSSRAQKQPFALLPPPPAIIAETAETEIDAGDSESAEQPALKHRKTVGVQWFIERQLLKLLSMPFADQKLVSPLFVKKLMHFFRKMTSTESHSSFVPAFIYSFINLILFDTNAAWRSEAVRQLRYDLLSEQDRGDLAMSAIDTLTNYAETKKSVEFARNIANLAVERLTVPRQAETCLAFLSSVEEDADLLFALAQSIERRFPGWRVNQFIFSNIIHKYAQMENQKEKLDKLRIILDYLTKDPSGKRREPSTALLIATINCDLTTGIEFRESLKLRLDQIYWNGTVVGTLLNTAVSAKKQGVWRPLLQEILARRESMGTNAFLYTASGEADAAMFETEAQKKRVLKNLQIIMSNLQRQRDDTSADQKGIDALIEKCKVLYEEQSMKAAKAKSQQNTTEQPQPMAEVAKSE